jgi:hypothetical protein
MVGVVGLAGLCVFWMALALVNVELGRSVEDTRRAVRCVLYGVLCGVLAAGLWGWQR